MALLFNAPSTIKTPIYDPDNSKSWEKQDKEYVESLRTWLKQNGYNYPNTGEIIRLPVDEGYAVYMIATMRPLTLIHLSLGNRQFSEEAFKLTQKEVKEMLDSEKATKEFFEEEI